MEVAIAILICLTAIFGNVLVVYVTMGVASMLNIALIVMNRYIKVVQRALYIKFFPSKRVAWLYCGLVWLCSLIIATPPLYGLGKL